MTLSECDRLLAEMCRRLRFVRAAGTVFAPAAAVLAVLIATVLWSKLAPLASPWMAAGAAALLAVLAVAAVFAVAWLRSPVSELAAAAELDRICGLKERASSLVAVRSGAAPRTAAASAIESDAAAALAKLDREAVLRATLPALPGRARWLVGLGAAALAALLVPARAPRQEQSLAEMLAGGVEAVSVARSGAAPDPASPAGGPWQGAARRVLTILQGPPPSGSGDAARRKQDLLALAGELRQSGNPADRELARRVEELAAQLSRLASAAPAADASESRSTQDADSSGRAVYLRSHPEYAELLARYFGEEVE